MKYLSTIIVLAVSILLSVHAEAQNFKKHIDYLASEQCEGRATMTHGDTLAFDYIVNELKSIEGVTLLGDNGGQQYTFGGERKANPDSCFLSIGKKKMTFGKQFAIPSFSGNINFKGNTIYVGEMNEKLVAPLDIKDKIVVFEDTITSSERKKFMSLFSCIRASAKGGAKGIILIADKADAGMANSWCFDYNFGIVNVDKATGERIIEEGAVISLKTVVEKTEIGQIYGRNVVAKIAAPKERNPKGECIVIGGHYDHLGVHSTETGGKDIYFGADDNASGTAMVIELARYISTLQPLLRCDVFIMAFGSEESGLIGSSYYANNPIEPLDNARAMLNFDMVGRMSDNSLWLEALTSSPKIPEFVASLPNADRINLVWRYRSPGGTDHLGFERKKIPCLSFCTGLHPDYHKPTDTPDKINYEGMETIYRYVTNIIDRLVLLNL